MKTFILRYYNARTYGSWTDTFVVMAESLEEAKSLVEKVPEDEQTGGTLQEKSVEVIDEPKAIYIGEDI